MNSTEQKPRKNKTEEYLGGSKKIKDLIWYPDD